MSNNDDANLRVIAQLKEENLKLKDLIRQCQEMLLETKMHLEINQGRLEESRKLLEFNPYLLNNKKDEPN